MGRILTGVPKAGGWAVGGGRRCAGQGSNAWRRAGFKVVERHVVKRGPVGRCADVLYIYHDSLTFTIIISIQTSTPSPPLTAPLLYKH